VIAVTTIEDKIKLFSKIIYEQAQEEKRKEFEKFESERATKIEEKKRIIEKKSKDTITEIQKKARLKASEIVSKEKISAQQQILAVREAFIEETISELKRLLSEFVSSQEYGELLYEQVKSIITTLDRGNYIFYLSQKDKAAYGNHILELLKNIEGLFVSIEIAKTDIIGGIIIEDEGKRYRLDNSFITKLEYYKHYVGLKVMESLK
jgi:V/A-type H+/Na+-transporting ATPase subunit E